jgi:hypothetical protein
MPSIWNEMNGKVVLTPVSGKHHTSENDEIIIGDPVPEPHLSDPYENSPNMVTTTTANIQIIPSNTIPLGPYGRLRWAADLISTEFSKSDFRSVVERMLAMHPDETIEIIAEYWNEADR